MSLSFGAPASAPAASMAQPLFGTTTSTTSTVAPTFPSFGFGATNPATSTTGATNLFSKPATNTVTFAPQPQTSTGFTFASPALSVAPAPIVTSSIPSVTAPTITTAQPKVGLGGVNPESNSLGFSSGSAGPSGSGTDTSKTNEQQSLKEQEIPASLKAEVTSFKEHVKRVKTVRENIARFSAKPFHKVLEDVNAMSKLLAELSNNLHKNVTTVEKLRFDTHRDLKNAEIAVRTRDTPPGLQYENVAPMTYFQYMVDDFEARMQTYRQQIEQLESYLAVSTGIQATTLSPQTLATLIQQIQDSFMQIAGQLQVVHEKIQTQKEHYLNYRKFILDDESDIFASDSSKPSSKRGGRQSLASTGPPPFGSTFAQKSTMASIFAALQATQQPAVTQQQVMPTATPGTMPFINPGSTGNAAPPTLSLGASKPTDLWGKIQQNQPPFGAVGNASAFTNSSFNASGAGGFGLPALSQTSYNSAGTLFGANPNAATVFGTPATAPLTLAKPPAGNKRGKR